MTRASHLLRRGLADVEPVIIDPRDERPEHGEAGQIGHGRCNPLVLKRSYPGGYHRHLKDRLNLAAPSRRLNLIVCLGDLPRNDYLSCQNECRYTENDQPK